MYNRDVIEDLVEFVTSRNGIADKRKLAAEIQKRYDLIRARSVFYGKWFAIRFCSASSIRFSNTVLALSVLRQYDTLPFLVCLVTPETNYMLLANATFLKRISHSSQDLRVNNIRGSFNGHDIMREFEGIKNIPPNFEFLFTSHENYTFEENLERLVEATNQISPTGSRFVPTALQTETIRRSISRAASFLESEEYRILNQDLYTRVQSVASEIAIAAFIDNINLRGRIIEYLITSSDSLKADLIHCLHARKPLPEVYTADKLGDYERAFDRYITETDIKTKILFLSSNPKGYNIDKLLSFLAVEKSVYMIYIVAIDSNKNIRTRLCSMYNKQLLSGTRIIKHWAGRNSRGVTQYDGKSLEELVDHFDADIDVEAASNFLDRCLEN